MRKNKWITHLCLMALVGGTLMLTPGCLEAAFIAAIADNGIGSTPRPAEPGWDEPYDPGYYEDALELSNPDLAGRMGAYEARDGSEVRVAEAYTWSDYTYVELRSRDSSTGATMAGLSVESDLASLEPGQVYETASWERGGDGSINMIGCAGPADGSWDFDVPADVVRLEIEELPGGLRRAHFTAEWSGEYYGGRAPSGPTTMTGQFDFDPAPR
jgi:hypothetical protein